MTATPPGKGQRFIRRYYLRGKMRPPFVSEHWVKDEDGRIVRYALSLIDHTIFPGDNGRVLGYDNAHGFHERHFMGKSTRVLFASYGALLGSFMKEVFDLLGEEYDEEFFDESNNTN